MPRQDKPQDLPELKLNPYRPTSGRQRLLIVLLTVATVVTVAAFMLRPHALLTAAKAKRAEAVRLMACPPGAASAAPGCPGGTMPVMMLPASPAPVSR